MSNLDYIAAYVRGCTLVYGYTYLKWTGLLGSL
jgi:hypothetical protein